MLSITITVGTVDARFRSLRKLVKQIINLHWHYSGVGDRLCCMLKEDLGDSRFGKVLCLLLALSALLALFT